MILRARYLAFIVCLVTPVSYTVADQAILIGGGYNINGSQGQIELNVKWVQRVLNQANMPVTTFFTDGDDPAPDVHYQQPDTPDAETTTIDELADLLEPVARLFGNQLQNQQRYRSHTVDNVTGSTRADSLVTSLKDLLGSAPDDPSLIVYNGHGKQSKSTDDKVTLELWDDTQLSANELHAILETSNAPSRFVFTQCYSGGFHRLAYANPASGLELSENMRCGFTSVSAYQLAEGCSASINTDDYRDYTTYFFAALNGYDRNEEILGVDPDSNQDGNVSLREAHFYTLEEAHSTDLSRSTSEDYLDRWQPWYLKWLPGRQGQPNNEYAKLYRTLADKHGIALSGNTAKSIRSMLKAYQHEASELQSRRSELLQEHDDLQQQLIQQASSKWPALLGPYTAMFQSMALSGELTQVASWLTEQPDYEKLVELQQENATIENGMLESTRNIAQMQKLLHFRKLASLKHELYQHGNASQISDYERLVSCEEAPLIFSE